MNPIFVFDWSLDANKLTYCYDSSGVLLWAYDFNSGFPWSMTVDDQFNSYYSTSDDRIIKLDVDGNLVWEVTKTPIKFSDLAVDVSYNVYAIKTVSDQDSIFKYDSDGQLINTIYPRYFSTGPKIIDNLVKIIPTYTSKGIFICINFSYKFQISCPST